MQLLQADVLAHAAGHMTPLMSSGISVLFIGNNFARLMQGLLTSITVAGLALIIGVPLGTILGSIRSVVINATNSPRNRPEKVGFLKNLGTLKLWKWLLLSVVRVMLRIYLELFRIIPTLVVLFIFYYLLPAQFGVNLSGLATAVIVFSLWIAAEMSDIVRGALVSVPDHQIEAAAALGLNARQIIVHVRIPQSIGVMAPAVINLAARSIMTTSLLLLISVIDIIAVGQQIMEANRMTYPNSAFWVYGFIFLLYFCCCWPLAMWAKHLEKRAEGRQHA